MAKLYRYVCSGNRWLILRGPNRAPVPGKEALDLKPFEDGKVIESSSLANEKEVIAGIEKKGYHVQMGNKVTIQERTASADEIERTTPKKKK
jgi:hypothetical protein